MLVQRSNRYLRLRQGEHSLTVAPSRKNQVRRSLPGLYFTCHPRVKGSVPAADILEAQAGMIIPDSSLAATRSTMTTSANSSKRHKNKQPCAERNRLFRTHWLPETAWQCWKQRDQQGDGDEEEERDRSNNHTKRETSIVRTENKVNRTIFINK